MSTSLTYFTILQYKQQMSKLYYGWRCHSMGDTSPFPPNHSLYYTLNQRNKNSLRLNVFPKSKWGGQINNLRVWVRLSQAAQQIETRGNKLVVDSSSTADGTVCFDSHSKQSWHSSSGCWQATCFLALQMRPNTELCIMVSPFHSSHGAHVCYTYCIYT